ncbi:unnamed protein product [Closterium sp. NIES-54]
MAFHRPDGLYEWLFMPFGLNNASAVFQKAMDCVLRSLQHCAACYIDDVVVFSASAEQHVKDVKRSCSTLRAIVGFLNYYRKFVPNFSKSATCLNQLLWEDVAWKWGATEQRALQDLLDAVKSGPVLLLPKPEGKFTLYSDWSSAGMGAVLCQQMEEGERVVVFAIRSFNAAEANYSLYEGEGLAAVWAVTHF